MSSALIVVDVQNDFVEGGALACSGGMVVAERLARLLGGYTKANLPWDYVVSTQDWHIAPEDHWSDTPDFKDTWPVHCVASTPGADFVPSLAAVREKFDANFYKGQFSAAYSGFEATSGDVGLHDWLQARAVKMVDVVGIALDYCVKATALDARKLGYATMVLPHYTASVSEETGNEALREMIDAGIWTAPTSL